MPRTFTWTGQIPLDARGTRLDHALSEALAHASVSREKIKLWIKKKCVKVDGAVASKPSLKLTGGEHVELAAELPDSEVRPEAGELHIVHKDDTWLVVDKPAGLVVHPAPSCPEGTLVHRLMAAYPELAAMEGFRPGIVHRIDKDTSGLLLVALEQGMQMKLSALFAERRVHKEYLAIVRGVPDPAEGAITEPMGRHPSHKTRMAVLPGGRPAHSEYCVLYADPADRFALVAVRIHTGRTHQIRVHMQHIGHTLWGDATYGPSSQGALPGLPPRVLELLAARQMLHAWKLSFTPPGTDSPVHFQSRPPRDFLALMLGLSRACQRIVVTGMPGCGKSTLLGLCRDAGLPTWSADAVVARLYQPGYDGHDLLRRRWGDRFLIDDGTDAGPVDKRALFTAMQESRALRGEIEDAIHPLVAHDLAAFWREHADAHAAVAEVPLYLETGGTKQTGWQNDPDVRADVIVGVHVPQAMRAERLKRDRGWDADTFAALESWQWPEDKKMAACDLVVDNQSDPADLAENTTALLADLKTRRTERLRELKARLHEYMA